MIIKNLLKQQLIYTDFIPVYALFSTLEPYLNFWHMKKTFTLLLFYGLVISAKAQPPSTTGGTGALLSMPETLYDFGKIPQGKPVSHVFAVVDSASDTLRIINVQASCGCTTPQWERGKKVAPGTGTEIIVGYNAANEGKFTKTITVTYNNNQTKIITITGEVWKTPSTSAPENNELQNLKNQ
jgi:Protein of unknown function (DUF1573)